MKAKFHYLFALIFLLSPSWLFGQCGVVTLNGQAEIDQFATNYPGCAQLDSLIIRYGSNGESVNLDGLASIQSIAHLKIVDELIGDESIASIDCSGLNSIVELESFYIKSESGHGPDGVASIGSATFDFYGDFNGMASYVTGSELRINVREAIYDETWAVFDSFNSDNVYIDIVIEDGSGIGEDIFPSMISGDTISISFYSYENGGTLTGFNQLHDCGSIYLTSNVGDMDCSMFNNVVDVNFIYAWQWDNSGEIFNALTNVEFLVLDNLLNNFVYNENSHICTSLQEAGSLQIMGEQIFSFDNLTHVGSLMLRSLNPWITYGPQFPVLESADAITVFAEGGGPNLAFPNMATITENFEINSLYGSINDVDLQSFGFPTMNMPALMSIGGQFLMENTAYVNLDGLSSLQTVSGVRIVDNVYLNNCDVMAFCHLMNSSPTAAEDGYMEVYGNLEGCNNPIDFLVICQENEIIGTIFGDLNCNGVFDESDVYINYPGVMDDNGNFIGISAQDGAFILAVDPSTSYHLAFETPEGYLPVDPIYITTQQNAQTFLFSIGFCPDPLYADVEVFTFPYDAMSPGFEYDGYLLVTNNSSSTVDVNMTLAGFNADYTSYVSSDITAIFENGILAFEPFSLAAYSETTIFYTMQIGLNAVMEELLNLTATVNIENFTEADYSNNVATFTEVVVGSFDPNDMMVNRPAINYDQLTAEGDWLTYRIRFQNTGTAPAQFIRVVSEQSDLLDLSTFDMLETSHSAELSFDGREVTWFFDNIQLPDSTTDLEGSQGYIFYRIRMNEGVTIDDVIANQAAIYFDFNEPVITNEATTVFYTCPATPTITQSGNTLTAGGTGDFTWYYNGELLSETDATIDMQATGNYQVSVSNEYCTSPFAEGNFTFVGVENLSNNQLVLFPNPTSDYFIISGNQGHYDEILIYSSLGELVMKTTWKHNAMIDVKDLPVGVYAVQLVTRYNGDVEHLSFVKQ